MLAPSGSTMMSASLKSDESSSDVAMRLSEKSIELNFCHQVGAVLGAPVWWFGTTQRQEREAGWDVASKIAGSWVRFQLKASNHVLRSGARRFCGHHHQLVELQARATRPLAVFYVFPTIGSTAQLIAAGFDLLPHLRFLDVYTVPGGIGFPTKESGALRKSELHNFDLDTTAGTVTIHSDPVVVPVIGLDGLGADIRGLARSRADAQDDPRSEAVDTREFLRQGRHRVAAFLPAV